MGIIQSEEMKDLRHERSSVMSCTPQKSSACPAEGANFGLSWAEHECYLLSPGNLHQSNLWRNSAEEAETQRTDELGFLQKSTNILFWYAGADVLVLMCRLSSYTRWEWVCDNLPMLKIGSPQVHIQRSLYPLRSSGGGS